MRCTLCHPTLLFNVTFLCFNNNIGKCKGLLHYNPIHGNTSMKKHLQNDHIKEIQQIQGKGEGKGWRCCRTS